jgi:hypothetical protein
LEKTASKYFGNFKAGHLYSTYSAVSLSPNLQSSMKSFLSGFIAYSKPP